MKKNQGHARSIATGLKFLFEREKFDHVIVMDGDGEDRPEEIKSLIEKAKDYPDTVITANRVKRSEGPIFKLGYQVHKYLTYIFTGESIKFGNYTCLPKSVVAKMIEEAATWSSFSGSLTKIAKERKSIPSIRALRYFGPSKMSFINLLKHSLSIIAVFKYQVLIRSLAIYFFLLLFLNKAYITVVLLQSMLVIFTIIIFIASRRENSEAVSNSTKQIKDIINIHTT